MAAGMEGDGWKVMTRWTAVIERGESQMAGGVEMGRGSCHFGISLSLSLSMFGLQPFKLKEVDREREGEFGWLVFGLGTELIDLCSVI